jgi:hypothetical protein
MRQIHNPPRRPSCFCLAFVALALPAHSATIVFGSGGSPGFNGVGNLGASITMPVHGSTTLTVLASGCAVGPCIIASSSLGGGSAGFGYGVNNNGGATDGANDPELNGPPEMLTLTFSSPVHLTGFTLEDVDDASNNGVFFNRVLPSATAIANIQDLTNGLTPPGSVYNASAATYASQPLWVYGTQFSVSASTGEYIRLRSVSFEAIPEPGTAATSVLALVFAAFAARRRRL